MSYPGASVNVPRLSNEFGSRRAGWSPAGAITIEEIPITNSAADCVIAVGANQAAGVTIQFNYCDGSPIKHVQDFELYVVSLDGSGAINGLATTGGSTGIAIGANGFIAQAEVSKKKFRVFTDKTGLAKLTWTDNAAEVAYLAVRLPSGRMVVSAQLPTA